jgi:hypothetical protein
MFLLGGPPKGLPGSTLVLCFLQPQTPGRWDTRQEIQSMQIRPSHGLQADMRDKEGRRKKVREKRQQKKRYMGRGVTDERG